MRHHLLCCQPLYVELRHLRFIEEVKIYNVNTSLICKARIFSLVDSRDSFSDLEPGDKNKQKALKMTSKPKVCIKSLNIVSFS